MFWFVSGECQFLKNIMIKIQKLTIIRKYDSNISTFLENFQ